MATMMKCGHAANARNKHTGKPVCVICVGINPGADAPDDSPPNLEGRTMECTHTPRGHADKPSDPNGAFFRYRPNMGTDQYYCGCFGWD